MCRNIGLAIVGQMAFAPNLTRFITDAANLASDSDRTLWTPWKRSRIFEMLQGYLRRVAHSTKDRLLQVVRADVVLHQISLDAAL